MKLVVLVVVVVLSVADWTPEVQAIDDDHHYLNSFAVQVDGGLREAQTVASDLGFLVHRELPNIGVFVLKHPDVNYRSKRSSALHISRLQLHPKCIQLSVWPGVIFEDVSTRFKSIVPVQERELQRVKRRIIYDKQLELPIREIKDNSVYHRVQQSKLSTRDFEDDVTFNDPLYKDMWYLKNHGQSGGEQYLDMNVQVAWANGFSGEGVVVCILDDGVDHTHPDLADNYDPRASGDLNDKSDRMHDPMPNMTNPGNGHGTRCAGEIAGAANNDVCGVGVAYNARIGGVRILDGSITDSLEGEALVFNSEYVDIYSASWGPNDDGKTMEAPSYFASQALRQGVQKGRGGLGNIYVWATGNGGMNGDDCNADGYTSSIESLSVGSITDWGRQPFYMENCTSTLAVVPTGGEEYKGQEADTGQIKLKVITTDVGGGCIENFQGTSSAAPLAAGCLANVLQANPSLTWRDVQHVVVRGTRIPSADASWTINGGGHHVSHKFGFGLMDCGKMVQVAQEWKNVPEQHVCLYNRSEPQTIEFGGTISDSIYIDACKEDPTKWIQRLEHVQVRIKLSTHRRGDTHIFLLSPSGTRSELLSGRPNDEHQGAWEFTFMTVHSWDETPAGKWRLEIIDRPQTGSHSSNKLSKLKTALDNSSPETKGFLEDWSLILYGTAGKRYGRDFSPKQETKKAYQPSTVAVQRMKRDETESARNVQVKRASTVKRQNEKRTNVDSNVSEVNLSKLAARLNHLLKQEETHEHVKRILNNQHPSAASKKSQRNLGHHSGSLDLEKDENLLEDVLHSIEHLLARSRKPQTIQNPPDQKVESQMPGQKQEGKDGKTLKRILTDLLEVLEKF